MRCLLLAILPCLAACSALPHIPAPWEPGESQLTEPLPPTDAATPTWTKIGSSIRGKPIDAVTLGSGTKRIYILGGIHGDEPEGPAAAALLPGSLLSDIISEAGQNATIRIVRDMNPDGTASNTRANTRGIDLNRNFPSRNYRPESLPGSSAGRRAASEGEVSTIHADLKAFKPDMVLVLCTASTGRGPAVSFIDRSKTLAYEFTAAARTAEPKWIVNRVPLAFSPGSFEALAGLDMGKPILSVEFRRGSEADGNASAVRAGILALASPPALKKAAAPQPDPPKAPILGGP